MSKKKRPSNPRRKNPPRIRPLHWAAMIVLAIGLAIGFHPRVASLWKPRPAPPRVDTSAMEPAAAELIEAHVRRVRENPGSGEAWGMLGGVLRSFLFKEEAEMCLGEAMRRTPNDARWPYLLGTLLAAKDTPGAITHLRRAVQICGNEPEAPRLHLARLLLETGHTGSARTELEALLQAKPGFDPARLALARVNQEETNWNDAIILADPCTTNPYTARAALTLLSTLYQRTGDTNAAESADRRARGAAPDATWPDPFEAEFLDLRTDARSLSDRAEQLLMARRPDEAQPFIQRLTNDYPDFAESWLLLGRMQLLQRDPVAAEKSIRRFLEAEPDSVNGNFQLGSSLLRQNRFEEAVAVFRRTTTLKEDFGPAFFNLGFALARSGKPAEAVPPFEEAIRHNPERIDSYILLADLYLQLGRKAEATDAAAAAERLNPRDPRVTILREKLK